MFFLFLKILNYFERNKIYFKIFDVAEYNKIKKKYNSQR